MWNLWQDIHHTQLFLEALQKVSQALSSQESACTQRHETINSTINLYLIFVPVLMDWSQYGEITLPYIVFI